MCVSGNRRRRSFLESENANITDAQPININSNESIGEKTKPLVEDMAHEEKHCVQHNYHDHALDKEHECVDRPLVSKGGVTVPFPMKLQNMLDYIGLAEPGLSEIVSWQPHGRCFLVHKPKQFADSVLPRFFQQKKYASFQRQLNLYGFNRITKGADRGSYYHELFLRGKQFLCRGIQRMKIKGTGSRMASNPDDEPNFYSMIPMGPIPEPIPESSSPPTPVSSRIHPATITSNSHIAVSSSSAAMPPLNTRSYASNHKNFACTNAMSCNEGSNDSSGDSAFDYVFDDMPFHSIQKYESRRHSLIDMSRQTSLKTRRNSLCSSTLEPQPDDEEFFKEIDFVSSFGVTALTDMDLGHILEKL